MKKLLSLLLLAVMILTLSACGGGDKQSAKSADLKAVLAKFTFDGEMLEMYYPGLGDIPAKQLLAKAPVMSYAVSEYVFLQADSEQDAAQAVKILQTRIDSQADGDAFYPETIDQWKAAKVLQNGAYVAMIASGEHQTEIEDAWNAQFGA